METGRTNLPPTVTVTTSTSPSSASPNGSLAAWQARSLHTITLPSGQRVRIRIPGLGTLLEHGDIPTDLLELAYMELVAEGGATAELARDISAAREAGKLEEARELIHRYAEFQRELARAALKEVELDDGFVPVELSMEQLREGAIPEDDLAMIAEIVQRLRQHDAKGVRIGVESIDRWGLFRETHGCPDEGCEGCARIVERLSSADVGDV